MGGGLRRAVQHLPKGEHDDDVDALTQALVYMQRHRSTLSVTEILRAGESDYEVDEEDEHGGRRGGGGFNPPRMF